MRAGLRWYDKHPYAPASDSFRAEVLARLRALDDARPERSAHLSIDVAQHGEPLSITAVQRALEELWQEKMVVHVGRAGWRARDVHGVQLDLELGDG